MKNIVLIIRVCKHSDIKFESKNQFCKYLKIVRKSRKLPDNWTIFNIFAKSFSALKFDI